MTNELLERNFFESSTQYHPSNSDLITHTRDLYRLERLATQYKNVNDWNRALSCLYEVKNSLESMDDPHYADLALRLALYLQQAGRFEEAKFELQSLVDDLDYIVSIKIRHHSEDDDYNVYEEWAENLLLSEIFDTARKIYKREKHKAESEKFGNLAIWHREKYQKCNAYLDEQRKTRLEEFEKHRETFIEADIQADLPVKEERERSFFWLWTILGFLVYLGIKKLFS